MKTFETEKHNIPEGATHYSDEDAGFRFAWYKKVEGVGLIWIPDDFEKWCPLSDQEEFGDDCVKEIPIPQTKGVEWDGEGLPPVGCKIKTKHGVSEVLSTSDWDGGVVTYSYDDGMSIGCAWNNKSWVNPIETEEQRKEREELEAAEDLYNTYMRTWNNAYIGWGALDDKNKEAFLTIVRKTGYRVEK